jgi:hypothetical protein
VPSRRRGRTPSRPPRSSSRPDGPADPDRAAGGPSVGSLPPGTADGEGGPGPIRHPGSSCRIAILRIFAPGMSSAGAPFRRSERQIKPIKLSRVMGTGRDSPCRPAKIYPDPTRRKRTKLLFPRNFVYFAVSKRYIQNIALRNRSVSGLERPPGSERCHRGSLAGSGRRFASEALALGRSRSAIPTAEPPEDRVSIPRQGCCRPRVSIMSIRSLGMLTIRNIRVIGTKIWRLASYTERNHGLLTKIWFLGKFLFTSPSRKDISGTHLPQEGCPRGEDFP